MTVVFAGDLRVNKPYQLIRPVTVDRQTFPVNTPVITRENANWDHDAATVTYVGTTAVFPGVRLEVKE